MAFTYTKDQEKVINIAGANILVSAAAGSGKTAVLVARIIQKIIHPTNRISIDQLLIVTFTNAAAAEMRERIGSAIEKAIDEADNQELLNHLIQQLTLLSNSHIMTLHSFCLKILRSYYHIIDLDPAFRIGNETELVLLQEEVMEELLEEEYHESREEFLKVIESFAPGKDDIPIKELILSIHRFSRSHPWPQNWLEKAIQDLSIQNIEELYQSTFFEVLVQEVKASLDSLTDFFREMNVLMSYEGGPDKYKDTFEALLELRLTMIELIETKSYSKISRVYANRDIPPLSRKSKGYDKELAAQGKLIIDQIKKQMTMIELICIDEERILDEIHSIHQNTVELVRLTQLFSHSFQKEKKEKNIIDFSDIEHFALSLLYNDETFSEIAKGYKEQFEEILVDEYQDINDVQEAILQGVCRQLGPTNNLFMVGDLKQSIYKFRLARPEIFGGKYKNFTYHDSDSIKIDLAKNFRSRQEVLDFTNLIFEKVMSLEIGDVTYDDTSKLHLGSNEYLGTGVKYSDYRPEIILVEQEDNNESKATVQARVISQKIKELVIDMPFKISDGANGLRPIEYGDICILLRSPSGSLTDMKLVLEQNQIPYKTDVSSGYFNAIEVQIVMNMLRVIDNPYQDIPMLSVLRSPLIGLNEKELLIIREYKKDCFYYEALIAFSESTMDTEDILVNKVLEAIVLIKKFREMAKFIPLDELIHKIYQSTGFQLMVGFMENGQQRWNNLKYLEIQALKFEASSYKGLFNFVRYIEHIEKYEIEIPEPSYDSVKESTVKIMSIHKSKGLEFPIVFIMDIHKQFNMMDLKKNFMLHQDMGIGSDYINPDKRIRKESVFMKALKQKSKIEILSEELRILYVALTRGKEKLYLIGITKDYEDKVKGDFEKFQRYEGQVPTHYVASAKCYMDWIVMGCPSENSIYYSYKVLLDKEIGLTEGLQELNYYEDRQGLKELLLHGNSSPSSTDMDFTSIYEPYRYEDSTRQYITLTVSELKKRREVNVFDDGDAESLLIKTIEEKKPRFLTEENKENEGAIYGLIMHKILSKLPIKGSWTREEIKDYIGFLGNENIIAVRDLQKVNLQGIFHFLKSSIYKRMVAAENNKALFREKSFVLGIKEQDDTRMIQGVIDVFFVEDDHIVLLDYKTDYIQEGEESILILRYQVQLDYYKKALEEITKLKVSEVFLYSLSLNKLIDLG